MSKRTLREAVKKQVAYSQQYKCGLCNVLLPPTFQVDHIVPHSISMDDTETNLQALCPNCHARKTQSENMRILQFKKRQAHCDVPLCWFCLEILEGHICNRVLRDIELPKKVVLDPFSQECNKHIYIDSKGKTLTSKHRKVVPPPCEVDRTLKIEVHLYSLCIYVNDVVYKSNTGDLTVKDIAEAVDIATRTKRDSGRYNSIEVKIEHAKEEDATEEENIACCEHIEDELLAKLPERIFQKNARIFILVEY